MAKTPIDYTKITEENLGFVSYMVNLASQIIMGVWLFFANRMTVSGKENIIKPPAVIASNHISGVDPPLLASVFRYYPTGFMAKIELFESWLGALYYRNVGTFAVNREKVDKSTIKSSKAVINKGWYLAVFPEGTRNPDGKLQEFKKGAVYMARINKAPMIPVAIARKDKGLFAKIHVEIGEPIPYNDDLDEANIVLRRSIEALLEKANQKIGKMD